MKIQILHSPESFSARFADCCRRFNRVEIAVAWCGNPSKMLPYGHLDHFAGRIDATIGTSFNHTHPDAIQWLKRKRNANVRVFRDDMELFHPKVYLFTRGDRYALLVGSSNLTYGGFYSNFEINIHMEGTLSPGGPIAIRELQRKLVAWRSDQFSLVPTSSWLKKYRKLHASTVRRTQKHSFKTESRAEEEIASSSWLRNADWQFYHKQVVKGASRDKPHVRGITIALDAASQFLRVPWKVSYFDNIEGRRVINGIGKYGSLGHVGASGSFQKLIANGSIKDHRTIANCMNEIASLSLPIPWARLESTLRKLVRLGPTMKVWGRLLCLVRPDLFCTVAATSVRANLSQVLKIPQSSFVGINGYIKLIRLIHASPWFNSSEPRNKQQARIWHRRAAFLDAIFY